MIIETPAAKLTQALLQGDSVQGAFGSVVALASEPTADGYINVGSNKSTNAPLRLFFMPYASIGAGSNFSMRLWGWRYVGTRGGPWIWIPFLLAEIACTTCDSPMPANPAGQALPDPLPIPDNCNLCDTLTLVQGDLGLAGRLNVTGPGSNIPAFGLLDLVGSQRIYFEFSQSDAQVAIGMNCLWCFA